MWSGGNRAVARVEKMESLMSHPEVDHVAGPGDHVSLESHQRRVGALADVEIGLRAEALDDHHGGVEIGLSGGADQPDIFGADAERNRLSDAGAESLAGQRHRPAAAC